LGALFGEFEIAGIAALSGLLDKGPSEAFELYRRVFPKTNVLLKACDFTVRFFIRRENNLAGQGRKTLSIGVCAAAGLKKANREKASQPKDS
jgi:hypothetical protein